MTGTHYIEVKNRDAVFKFDLHRNITIIRGDNLSCDKNSNMF